MDDDGGGERGVVAHAVIQGGMLAAFSVGVGNNVWHKPGGTDIDTDTDLMDGGVHPISTAPSFAPILHMWSRRRGASS